MRECPACYSCYEDNISRCPRDKQELERALPWSITIGGKYRINSLLGRGGMSAVYRATQLELARPVAIKILLPELLADASAPERLRREALASARIEHPNVVTVYDYGTVPSGAGYLVMRLLRGHALSKELRKHGRLPFERVFNIMFQICSAVEAAHRLGIVHCDLKPENVFLEDTDVGETVQILDFGIAKMLKSSDYVHRVTLSGVILGTPLYMSPEQCESRELDSRTDIYSLGVALYEMLTGAVPFDGDNSAIIAKQHLSKMPEPPSKARPQITPKLEKCILKAMAKARTDRQQSITELVEELKAASQEMAAHGLIDLESLPLLARGRNNPKPRPPEEHFRDQLHPSIHSETPSSSSVITEQVSSSATQSGYPVPTEQWSSPAPHTSEVEVLEDQIVLIVDDEPGIILLLEAMLDRLGCQTLTAENGREALEIVNQCKPDLIVSDIMMPDMDGYQLYQELQRNPEFAAIPLIFLTARTQQHEKLQALAHGVEDYWTKPFDVEEVNLRLKRILNRLKRMKKLEKR